MVHYVAYKAVEGQVVDLGQAVVNLGDQCIKGGSDLGLV
jgi:hypothetical protein